MSKIACKKNNLVKPHVKINKLCDTQHLKPTKKHIIIYKWSLFDFSLREFLLHYTNPNINMHW